jgi:hypothetical protein
MNNDLLVDGTESSYSVLMRWQPWLLSCTPGKIVLSNSEYVREDIQQVEIENTASGTACLQGISVQELSRYNVEVDTITKSMMALAELQPWPSWESSSNNKILSESFPGYNGWLPMRSSSIGPDLMQESGLATGRNRFQYHHSFSPTYQPKGTGALLCFFGFFSQAEAKRRHAATQDYYINIFCDQVHSGRDHSLACAVCYLNVIKVCLDYDTHCTLGAIMNHQVPWDPGGLTRYRLGVKPRFKEGGMLATFYLADGPLLLGQASPQTDKEVANIYQETTIGGVGLDLDGFGLHNLWSPSSSLVHLSSVITRFNSSATCKHSP